MKLNLAKLPYRTPDTEFPGILLEQGIATASSNDNLGDMGVDDVYDDPFDTF